MVRGLDPQLKTQWEAYSRNVLCGRNIVGILRKKTLIPTDISKYIQQETSTNINN